MKRINLKQVEPKAYEAMYALEKYLAQSSLGIIEKELIKIRASQINGCAFCIDMHTREALAAGESAQRIFLLSAWRECDLFSKKERVLLTVVEEVTLIHEKGLSEKTYNDALESFGENKLGEIIMAIVTINAWNRMAIATEKPLGT